MLASQQASKKVNKKWTFTQIQEIYETSLLNLVYQAATEHRKFFDPQTVQLCTLLSVKTGSCPEDCSYCSQSSRHQTFVEPEKLITVEEVVKKAKIAKKNGATRFCMGAAWRNLVQGKQLEKVTQMIREVNDLDLQVCCSMGMLSSEQAKQLKEAGLYAYNHNLDTSPEYYDKIITTRNYQDRLDTLQKVGKAGISICCGCILGLGESEHDRIRFIEELTKLDFAPESIPINTLVPVENTPLHSQKKVSVLEVVKMVATVRIVFPQSVIRLSAGRLFFSEGEQALFFLAGANSFFMGEKLLTTPNNEMSADVNMLNNLELSGILL